MLDHVAICIPETQLQMTTHGRSLALTFSLTRPFEMIFRKGSIEWQSQTRQPVPAPTQFDKPLVYFE